MESRPFFSGFNYPDAEFNILKDFTEALGIEVEIRSPEKWTEEGRDGLLYGDKRTKRPTKILLLKKEDDTSFELAERLAHELGHVFLHPGRCLVVNGTDQDEKNADACGIALLQLARYNLLSRFKDVLPKLEIDYT